jgi:hypothetical protein
MANDTEKLLPSLRTGIYGASMTVAGILLSGPLGLLLVWAVHPSPPWEGARVFVEHFHPIQTFPFFGGFALVFGYVMMIAAIHHIADEGQKTLTLIAVMFTTSFSTLIFLNYIAQTTLIPALALNYDPAMDPLISAFSLANPLSYSWAIEMWGYVFLGLATWCVAPVFQRNRFENATGTLLALNGLVSIAGALVTVVDLGWVMTTAGLLSYAVWNLLVLVMGIFVIVSLHRRRRDLLSTKPMLLSVN